MQGLRGLSNISRIRKTSPLSRAKCTRSILMQKEVALLLLTQAVKEQTPFSPLWSSWKFSIKSCIHSLFRISWIASHSLHKLARREDDWNHYKEREMKGRNLRTNRTLLRRRKLTNQNQCPIQNTCSSQSLILRGKQCSSTTGTSDKSFLRHMEALIRSQNR